MRRLIDANALIAAYDAQHEGVPGRARKLTEDTPTIDPGDIIKDFFETLGAADGIEITCDVRCCSECPASRSVGECNDFLIRRYKELKAEATDEKR